MPKLCLTQFLCFVVCTVVQSLELEGKLGLDDIYQRAIADAAVADPDEYLPLRAIPEGAETVRVVTWTNYPSSYTPGEATVNTWGDVWVTLIPEVQELCTEFTTNRLRLRVQQLLGLPNEPEKERSFVEVEVRVEDLFRPCSSPDVHSDRCPDKFTVPDPNQCDSEFASFFANQVIGAYVPDGYPWTRLGYTYDWDPHNPDDEYGASEYVVKKGSTMQTLRVVPTEEYCASTPPTTPPTTPPIVQADDHSGAHRPNFPLGGIS